MRKNPIVKNQNSQNSRIPVGIFSSDFKNIPKPKVSNYSTNFTFSLKYFNQIKYFQLGQQNGSWYVSLIERLQELSKKERELFLKDIVEKQEFRYHEINWCGEGVPIKRKDLNWIDPSYLNNEEEFPFIQFHVSQALGRLVGFWDENYVFQIVLLDPLHNIQPSKRYNYKVNDTYHMSSQYSSLMVDILRIKKKIKGEKACPVCLEVSKMPTQNNDTNLLIAHIDDTYIERLNRSNLPIEDILELGILSLGDQE